MIGKTGIPFIKMQGIGNDYIYIDELRGDIPDYLKEENLPELSRKISDRHFGVGSDGLILILPSSKADFRMRIFNADGSEAKMCGNGIRCVGKYVRDLGFTDKSKISVETNSGIKYLDMIEGPEGVESVIVDMGSPYFLRKEIPAAGNPEDEMNDMEVEMENKIYKVSGVSMGNPHGVVFVNEVDGLDLEKIGRGLETNEIWPDRANIEFVEVINPEEIKVRVWERGSGETMACGTGACAATVMSYRKGLTASDVKVHLRGGELKISYNAASNRVKMEGPAEFVAKGEFWTRSGRPAFGRKN